MGPLRPWAKKKEGLEPTAAPSGAYASRPEDPALIMALPPLTRAWVRQNCPRLENAELGIARLSASASAPVAGADPLEAYAPTIRDMIYKEIRALDGFGDLRARAIMAKLATYGLYYPESILHAWSRFLELLDKDPKFIQDSIFTSRALSSRRVGNPRTALTNDNIITLCEWIATWR